ncbi:hypothetical protein [Flectobacillus major]|jgi:hypothetical protein|uniref:hypothetical protein n=1 Tax=Flectobacillus major TaxID=103 RepID=UPI0004250584|nr:hypothetical protein [Flectobacillus major]
MKKRFFILLLLVLSSKLLIAQNVTSPQEQASIKQVISDEAKYYVAKDYDKWILLYRQTPQVYFATTEKGKMIQKDGWDALNSFVTSFFAEGKKNETATYKRENVNFRKVNPTYVWLTFDQVKTFEGKKEATKELRIVELIKGEWKIVNRTGFLSTNPKLEESKKGEDKPEKKQPK